MELQEKPDSAKQALQGGSGFKVALVTSAAWNLWLGIIVGFQCNVTVHYLGFFIILNFSLLLALFSFYLMTFTPMKVSMNFFDRLYLSFGSDTQTSSNKMLLPQVPGLAG